MTAITILLADDHTLFREGVRAICEIIGNFKVLGEAGSGYEAVKLAGELSPDIVLMDINMPELSGVEAARQITKNNPSVKVIMLTIFRHDDHLFDAIKAGARGYILKDTSGEKLVEGIRSVYNGEATLPRRMAAKILDEFRLLSNADNRSGYTENLTQGEMEVLQLVAQGKGNRSIAAALSVSEKTVSNRLSEIFAKLHVNNRTQAALHAIRKGWADLWPEEKPDKVKQK